MRLPYASTEAENTEKKPVRLNRFKFYRVMYP